MVVVKQLFGAVKPSKDAAGNSGHQLRNEFRLAALSKELRLCAHGKGQEGPAGRKRLGRSMRRE
jgi:hypothetical protein